MAGKTARAEQPDLYALRAEDVQEPPTTLRGRLRYLGPGMILSAAVIGSGELILTTSLGARAGFALMWLIIVATTVKVWVQMELGRLTVLYGRPALEAFSDVAPRTRRGSWINYLWIGMDFAKMFQRGGIIGGAAAACSILFPIVGEPLSRESTTVWCVVIVVITIAILQSSKYSIVETASVIAVAMFTMITVGLALALPFTEFGWSMGDIAGGLELAVPVGALGLAVAMFGSTGVGADEMTTYTYWCMEKGYARWTGPADGTPERDRRAEGWLKVMRLDVAVSWLVCTICTVAFYIIGASVLHPQGLVPEGNEMITTLSRMYTDTIGGWAEIVFLVGAIAVLFSTNIGSTASVPRLWTNTLGIIGVLDWKNPEVRRKTIRLLTFCFPPLWASFYLFVQSPVLMVQIGGIGSGVFLIAVVIGVWYLRTKEPDKRFRPNPFITGALVVSSIAIMALGVYSALEVFGISIG
ncbi:Mn2+/Fe2+ NRAMP family transporter [Actinoalloteichus hoggarensis]|uniref:Divalent metal cation transporter MntH n=1 Tax=Actinoalloteichus hoggarensis TaxID=1470176 RepID=A0A221VWI1_9PSEU|nr:Nramp family divalent metal transporter [Actinoalloteichus hoggarensis]ASO17858.1 Divalent metal cation transporter MntH [Actinoalloteichus hoggarensis]MBB5924270.1 Mn2+/Fe2+ NRAMP family transporter [Actinoalloteichus hoggarensis]